MQYQIKFKSRAIKDLRSFPTKTKDRIIAKIEAMQNNLEGDIKKLTNFTPEYRLRIGNYRVLFEIETETLIIYRIKHRKNAYN